MASELSTKVLDHLGLVSGMCDELDLVNQIDTHLIQDLSQRDVSIGTICKALIGVYIFVGTVMVKPKVFNFENYEDLHRRV